MSIWMVQRNYGYTAVEFVKETAQMIIYIDHAWRKRETRGDKRHFLDWRGSEDEARALVAKLTSASSERDRRVSSANAWFDARVAALVDRNPEGGDVKQAPSCSDESAGPQDNAQEDR